MADDISSGAKTGIKAAQNAKRAISTIGKASTGNVVGAAIDAARSPFFRGMAVVLLVAFGLLIFCAVFLIPMAIYEAIDKIVEQWKVDFYSGTSGRFVSFFKATAQAAGNIARWITGANEENTGDGDTDIASEADAGVTSKKSDFNIVYIRKLQAAKDKITARQQQVVDLLNKESRNGVIADIMYSRFLAQFGQPNAEYDFQYDPIQGTIISAKVNKYGGTKLIATRRTIRDMEALQLLCLHTAQKDGDLANVKLSGFMKWLGYNGANNKQLSFPLGDNENIRFSMKSWTGGFIPQYLEDEAAAVGREEAHQRILNGEKNVDENKEAENKTAEYEKKYGAPIVDMLIQVECPSLYSIAPQITEELKYDAGHSTREVDDLSRPIYGPAPGDIYPAYLRDTMPSDYYQVWIKEGYRYVTNAYCEGRYGNFLYATAGWRRTTQNGIVTLVRTANNAKRRGPLIGYEKMTVEYTYDITYYTVTYNINATVKCRDINSLLNMAGLWQGVLPWDAPDGDNTVEPADEVTTIVISDGADVVLDEEEAA